MGRAISSEIQKTCVTKPIEYGGPVERSLKRGAYIKQVDMAEERSGVIGQSRDDGSRRRPSEAEIAELLHYFQGVASPNARRQVIAKARMTSNAQRMAVTDFERAAGKR